MFRFANNDQMRERVLIQAYSVRRAKGRACEGEGARRGGRAAA